MIPSAATARSATSGDCPPTWLGQTWARATPKAGGSAVIRSVTASAVNTPSTENPITVTSGPSTSSSTSARPLRAALRATSIAAARSPRRGDERQALLALPVGRLDDDRPGDLRQVVVAPDDPRPRLRHTGGGEPLALAQLVGREDRRLRRDRMRQPGMLRDPRGDADRPVRARRDDPVDPERPDEPLDRGLVLGREDAAPVGEREPGRAGVAIDHGQPEPARTRGLEQTELSGAGP